MRSKTYLFLIIVGIFTAAGCIYNAVRPKVIDEPPKKEPTQVVEMAINGMVSTRIEKMESIKPILPDEFMVDFDTVESSGDEELSYWLDAYNDQMIVEAAKGKWISKYILQGNTFYKYDEAEKMKVPAITLELSAQGATYTVDDKVVSDPIECALSGYDIVTEDDMRFGITTYGCLEYVCDSYSVILVKE